jgi:hypothetical protein
MPDYLKRVGRDTTDDTIIRTGEAERTIARLRGPASKRLGIDRGSIPSVAAPLEGQMMIQYDDEAVGGAPVSPEVGATFHGESPYYFSNGEWRPFVSGGLDPDYGYYETAGVTLPADTGPTKDSWAYHSGTAILDLTDPTQPAFTQRGVYAVTGVVSFDSWTPGVTCFPHGFLGFHPDLGSWVTADYFQSISMTNFSNFPPPQGVNLSAFEAEVASWLTLEYFNFDHVNSHAFSATQIRVQRVFSF